MYKLIFCTSCNLYKKPVQVATCTRLAVHVVTCTEFHYQIIPTCTILLYKLDLKRSSVKSNKFEIFLKIISSFMCINIQIQVRVSYIDQAFVLSTKFSMNALLSCSLLCPPTGGWTYYFCFFRRPASHLVSRHFRQQFLSYRYQIWHAGLLG